MKKIMVIDDETDILTYLMAVLEDNGFEACTLDTTSSVNQIVEMYSPDLILLDVMMPNRSGISIYKELRMSDTNGNTPVVILSGISPAKDFYPNGFKKLLQDDTISLPSGFIEKPIQVSSLLKTINSLLGV